MLDGTGVSGVRTHDGRKFEADMVINAAGSWAGEIAGIADKVEPMACPALAIVRRGEKAIDELRKSIRRVVGEKSVDLRRRWREADQVEGDAADERAFIGGWCGSQAG